MTTSEIVYIATCTSPDFAHRQAKFWRRGPGSRFLHNHPGNGVIRARCQPRLQGNFRLADVRERSDRKVDLGTDRGRFNSRTARKVLRQPHPGGAAVSGVSSVVTLGLHLCNTSHITWLRPGFYLTFARPITFRPTKTP